MAPNPPYGRVGCHSWRFGAEPPPPAIGGDPGRSRRRCTLVALDARTAACAARTPTPAPSRTRHAPVLAPHFPQPQTARQAPLVDALAVVVHRQLGDVAARVDDPADDRPHGED